MNEKMISVPESWFLTLLGLEEKINKQIDELNPEDFHILMQTDISALLGFVSSAKTILKYNAKIISHTI